MLLLSVSHRNIGLLIFYWKNELRSAFFPCYVSGYAMNRTIFQSHSLYYFCMVSLSDKILRKSIHSRVCTMMRRSKVVPLLLILGLLVMFWLISVFYLPGYLKVKRPLDSPNVVIESWIPAFAIERTTRNFVPQDGLHFYITGQTFPDIPFTDPGYYGNFKKIRLSC